MNKDLIIKRDEISNRSLETNLAINSLSKFIENYENLFIESDSKSALIRMKAYLGGLKELSSSLYQENEEIREEIRKTCQHEILARNYDQLSCKICGDWFYEKDVNFSHVLLESGKKERFVCDSRELYNAILSMAKKGEDPIEFLEEYLYSNPYSKDLKIYKRRML